MSFAVVAVPALAELIPIVERSANIHFATQKLVHAVVLVLGDEHSLVSVFQFLI